MKDLTADYKGYTACAVLAWFVSLFAVTGISARAQEVNKAASLEDIIYRLEIALEKHEYREAEILVEELKHRGEEAIPVIQSTLDDEDSFLRATLIGVLGGIRGDRATNTLLELTLQSDDRELSAMALVRLENRTVQRFLTRQEVRVLTSWIEEGNVIQAGMAARLLARSTRNDAVERMKPIISRFTSEVESPSAVRDINDSYLSGEVYALNQFLIAFSTVDAPVVISLLRSELQGAGGERLRNWLTIAMGMAGDEAVSEELRQIINTEKDVSVRAVALRAYAHAAKEKAIPVLAAFVEDRTSIGKSTFYGELFPLQIVARDELARLKHEME